ncbi:ABC transporter permease [filamentous cyanobacterium LEGE 11480]|uniref:ABC transporter permease n=1 Tax=Romeriopsis navalis LEGE 11480 TaxID=2777977 RepID=A0A928VV48_9CYAN|nr:ABC transporter permease [Romeriopsis navalis]MBE9032789.1 ABC transporter permease [Romeriopsis navalis LEGE 11480]
MASSKIARKNLLEDKTRFIVAQAGILFAVSLVTIQLGILRGFTRSTAMLVEYSSADLWVAHKEFVHFELTSSMPAENLQTASQVAGVDRAEVLMVRSGRWRNTEGELSTIRIWGFNPNSGMFAGWPIVQGKLADLNQPYKVFLDSASVASLDVSKVGDTARIGNLPVEIVGLTEDTKSNASSAYVYTSLETANAYGTAEFSSAITCSRRDDGSLDCNNKYSKVDQNGVLKSPPPPERLDLGDPITYIMIRAKSGEDLNALKIRLKNKMPDTVVFTTDELAKLTRNYWEDRTSVGFILGLGATVGFIVGMVIVGQILYASVADHIREFGTLKAMGASNWVIYSVIIEQSLWMAVLGYLPSMAFCLGLSKWTLSAKGVLILIEPTTAASVFVLTLFMCVGSAVFAVQKVTRVDPAIVFKA